ICTYCRNEKERSKWTQSPPKRITFNNKMTLADIQKTLDIFSSRAWNFSTQLRRQQPQDPSMEM
ncbi:Hypothetical predicted protein, partial [Lynx pardinus]